MYTHRCTTTGLLLRSYKLIVWYMCVVYPHTHAYYSICFIFTFLAACYNVCMYTSHNIHTNVIRSLYNYSDFLILKEHDALCQPHLSTSLCYLLCTGNIRQDVFTDTVTSSQKCDISHKTVKTNQTSLL